MLVDLWFFFHCFVLLVPLKIAKLQDDNKALDRLTKSKEAALIEAERTVQVALAKASMVDDLQNKNQELMKQIEICQVLQACMILFILLLWICWKGYLFSLVYKMRKDIWYP